MSRSVGIELPTDTVSYARRMEFWALPLPKPKNFVIITQFCSVFFTHKKHVALLVARTATDTCKCDWERITVEQRN